MWTRSSLRKRKSVLQWNLSIDDAQIADMPWIADKMFSPKCDNLTGKVTL